jgi:hypothetical protein
MYTDPGGGPEAHAVVITRVLSKGRKTVLGSIMGWAMGSIQSMTVDQTAPPRGC